MDTNNSGEPSEQHPDDQLLFLEALAEGRASIDGDVVEIDAHTWAIHGFIPVDGEVIMAEYETLEEATEALSEHFGVEHKAQPLDDLDQPGSQSAPERRSGNE